MMLPKIPIQTASARNIIATCRPLTPNVLSAAISSVRRRTSTSIVLMMPTPPSSIAPRPNTTMNRPSASEINSNVRSMSCVERTRKKPPRRPSSTSHTCRL
jgi:hypothetical protein